LTAAATSSEINETSFVPQNLQLSIKQASRNSEVEVRKASSMNSMYISTTITTPSIDTMISGVATILYSQMLEDMNN
jgi:hypothetical protein